MCDEQCSADGCWGKGAKQCLTCADKIFDEDERICLKTCNDLNSAGIFLYYDDHEKKCKRCHHECKGNCKGPSQMDCDTCKNVVIHQADGNKKCNETCGKEMYPNEDGVCMKCNDACEGEGCTGPGDHLGEQGCNSCIKGIRERKDMPIYCVKQDNEDCWPGYFKGYSKGTVNAGSFQVG